MKIGILTFHCASNYGAVLQCYALWKYLSGMGHDVEVIDYRPPYLIEPYRLFKGGTLRGMLRSLYLSPQWIVRNLRFRHFLHRNMRLSGKVPGKMIPEGYDAYVFGSDQIWNPEITGGYDGVYFGRFGFPKGERKYISYAASMKPGDLSGENAAFIGKALGNFDAISVREADTAEVLRSRISRPVVSVLDPTLLADRSIWYDMASKPLLGYRYVLVYQVRDNAAAMDMASRIAAERGCRVVSIKAWISVYNSGKAFQKVSPEQFVRLFRYADCVVTTSFHGTAFSLIFERPFFAVSLGDGNDWRVRSLLENLGMENRILSPGDEMPDMDGIDYDKVEKAMSVLRAESENFLREAFDC